MPSAKEILRNLPRMIEIEEKRRYLHNPIVNDIEWSALATVYNCCSAVKFLPVSKPHPTTCNQSPGWKIAVPTPRFFGSKPSPGLHAGSSCVFMRCYSSPKVSVFVPLIPCDKPVFATGREVPTRGNSKDVPDSESCIFSRTHEGKLPAKCLRHTFDFTSDRYADVIILVETISRLTCRRQRRPPIGPLRRLH